MYLPKTDDPAFEDLIEDYLDEAVGDQMALRIEVRLREDREAREVLLNCLTARSLLGLALGEPDPSHPPGPACAEIRSLRSRYARGSLDARQQARLCTHLEGCPSCESHYAQPEESPGVSWRRFAAIGVAIGALALISSIGWGGLREGGGTGSAPASVPAARAATPGAGLAIIPGLPEFWDELKPLMGITRREEGSPGIEEACDTLADRGILDAVVTHPEVESRLEGLVDPDADRWTRERVAVLVAVLLDEQVPQEDRIPAVAAVRQLAGKRALPFLWHLAGLAESGDFHRRVMVDIMTLARRGVDPEALARECQRALVLGWTNSALSCLQLLQRLGDPRAAGICRDVLAAPPAGATQRILRVAAEGLLCSLASSSQVSDSEELVAAIDNPLGQVVLVAALYAKDPRPRWHALAANHITDPDPRVRDVVASHLMQREDTADRALCEILCRDPDEGIRGLAMSLLSRLDAKSSRTEEQKRPPRAR